MTPDLEKLAQSRRLDARCLDCGAEMAYSSWCYRCSSTNLELVPHQPERPCLSTGRAGHPASLRRGASMPSGAEEAPEPTYSACAPQQGALGL